MKPEDRQEKILSYAGAYEALVAALGEFPRLMWQFKPSPADFSIHEIIIHIADSEANSYVRCRRAIAEPGSAVISYDEMRWASDLEYHRQNPDDALELFKWLRRASYHLIRALPEDAWARTINHPENGIMTLGDWLNIYERHIPEHIRQMQEIFETWKTKTST